MMTHTNLLQLVTKAFRKYAFMMFAVALVYSIVSIISASPLQAETGKGTDVFKVIMTIFGVDKSKGDVVTIVTSNGVAKVKLLDAEAPYVIALNSSEGGGGNFIEYVATFPNVTVNAGDEYNACVLPVNDLALKCTTGQNSPASRPEFVDISLSDTPTAATTTTQGFAGIETSNNEDDISMKKQNSN
jgi:hypothetical protein